MTTTRRHPGVDGLDDGALGEGGRDEDDAHLGACGLLGLGDGAVDGDLDGSGLDLAAPGPMGVTSKETVVPALRGLTPATTFVPAESMRVVCLRPSEPVMPWTMTRSSQSGRCSCLRPPCLRAGR